MCLEIPSLRQPVISQSTFSSLDELRRFRHVVRSNYGHKLEREPILKLSAGTFRCYQALEQDLQNLLRSLEPKSQKIEPKER